MKAKKRGWDLLNGSVGRSNRRSREGWAGMVATRNGGSGIKAGASRMGTKENARSDVPLERRTLGVLERGGSYGWCKPSPLLKLRIWGPRSEPEAEPAGQEAVQVWVVTLKKCHWYKFYESQLQGGDLRMEIGRSSNFCGRPGLKTH